MDSDFTQSAAWYKLLTWFEVNKKQVILGAAGAIVLGVIVWFFVYQHQQKQIRADEALSEVFVPQVTGAAQKTAAATGYLNVAKEYPNAPAAVRALLLGAGALFADGKFAEAHDQFARLAREHRDSPFLPEAQLGVAASLDAQGKTNEAISAYQTIVDRRVGDNVVKPAKFALARLRESSGDHEKAYSLYEDLARTDPYTSLGSEAGMRAEEIKLKHPEVAKAPVIPTNAASPNIIVLSNTPAAQPAPTSTNK